jgi:capping protein beta
MHVSIGVDNNRFVKDGSWDSIHVIEVIEKPGTRKATYKLTTTVMLRMNVSKDEVGASSLSGSLTRQVIATRPNSIASFLKFYVCMYL